MSPTLAVRVLFLSLFAAASAGGQVSPPQRAQPPMSVGEVLARFEHDQPAGNVGTGPGASAVHAVLGGDDRWSAAALDSVANGLRRLALFSDNRLVRRSAAAELGSEGASMQTHPRAGAVARMISVYQRSNDPVVRGILVSRMPQMADRRSALAFLREVAIEKLPPRTESELPVTAVNILAALGPDGRAILRDLLAQNLVSDMSARGYIEYIEQNGTGAP